MSIDSLDTVLFWIGNAGVTGLTASIAFLVLIGACLTAGLIGMACAPAATRGHRVMYAIVGLPMAVCCGVLGFALVRDFAFAMVA
jgi:ABC-type sulfate transport system permease component